MVVAGVPERCGNHVQKVAGQALAMRREAGQVASPATGKPIQVNRRSVRNLSHRVSPLAIPNRKRGKNLNDPSQSSLPLIIYLSMLKIYFYEAKNKNCLSKGTQKNF